MFQFSARLLCAELLVVILASSSTFSLLAQPAWEFPYTYLPEGIRDFDLDDEGNIYAALRTDDSDNSGESRVVRWDGQEWKPLGPIFDGSINVLTIRENTIYVGGRFFQIGEASISNVALWNGQEWESLGGGLDDLVYDLEIHQDEICAGGLFNRSSTADGAADFNGIACWNGDSWRPMGLGFEAIGGCFLCGEVWTLHSRDNMLYAGGFFTLSGSGVRHSVAQWDGDGTEWQPLGSGLPEYPNVWTMTSTNSGEVFAGGLLQRTSDGATVHNVAMWDGELWRNLGEGFDGGQVGDLAFHEGFLYVGGGGLFLDHLEKDHGVARWSGSEWVTLGAGIPSNVISLAARGDLLYVGGSFSDRDGMKQVLGTWNGAKTVSIQPDEDLTGRRAILKSIYPNPFTHSARIKVKLNKVETIGISVFDVLGREAVQVFEGILPAGIHDFTLDGARLMPGMYILQVTSAQRIESMSVVKIN